jgi:hypothetical protein
VKALEWVWKLYITEVWQQFYMAANVSTMNLWNHYEEMMMKSRDKKRIDAR